MFKKIVIANVLSCSLMFGNGLADININNKTVQLGVEYSLENSFNLKSNSNYFFAANYLRSESDKNNSAQTLASVGVKMMNPYVDNYGFSFGLGIKGVVADNSENTFVALPLGIFASYMINDQFHVDSEFDYAPKVLAFSDGENYKEWNAKLNFKLIENGYLYLGSRGIKTSYSDDKKVSYDNSLFFGFKVQY